MLSFSFVFFFARSKTWTNLAQVIGPPPVHALFVEDILQIFKRPIRFFLRKLLIYSSVSKRREQRGIQQNLPSKLLLSSVKFRDNNFDNFIIHGNSLRMFMKTLKYTQKFSRFNVNDLETIREVRKYVGIFIFSGFFF
jgi:hypothetical protein